MRTTKPKLVRSYPSSIREFWQRLVATREFVKNEVVIDYHGQVFTKKTMEEVSAIEGVKREYCMEVNGPGRRIINASPKVCPVHPENRCMGRLANHCVAEANMKSTDIQLFAKPNHGVVVLRAIKPIKPFEHLRFGYEDPVARSEFSASQTCNDEDVYSQDYFPERNIPSLEDFLIQRLFKRLSNT